MFSWIPTQLYINIVKNSWTTPSRSLCVMWKFNESLLYQLNAYILNRPYVVICWIGGVGPHHKNEFDAILSVTGHNSAY